MQLHEIALNPIKINFYDSNNKRTSSTINSQIACFYLFHVHDGFYIDPDKLPPEFPDLVQSHVRIFVKENPQHNSKEQIEFGLLNSAYEAIKQKATKQPDLFMQALHNIKNA